MSQVIAYCTDCCRPVDITQQLETGIGVSCECGSPGARLDGSVAEFLYVGVNENEKRSRMETLSLNPKTPVKRNQPGKAFPSSL